ncbi:hypothetical protein [Dermabacter vaginalis]|uniref:Integrase SAM-like N-terminal domain-containing protein n=1 Tax=Dermabacter vaginalis TaxID=1630135 RepID=A0ABX6A7D2_9MICO|nr:hypothetical protein FOB48_09170 [Dermabacter vaginalis]
MNRSTLDSSARQVDPHRSNALFSSVAKLWLTNPSWSRSTRARYESIMTAHILPRWGEARLVDFDLE